MTPRSPAGAPSSKQTVIKRYANRRLFNSRTGKYVSRKSLEEMARMGEEFVVEDTTTGEDITHSVLGQIIVAQEAVQTQPLLPSEFMRRLLTFYGDTLRTLGNNPPAEPGALSYGAARSGLLGSLMRPHRFGRI